MSIKQCARRWCGCIVWCLWACASGLYAPGCSVLFPVERGAASDNAETQPSDGSEATAPFPDPSNSDEPAFDCIEGESCDDRNACTDADTCREGVCNGISRPACIPCESDRNCDDVNSCTDDACGSDGQCLYTNNTATCPNNGSCSEGDCVVVHPDRNSMAGLISNIETDEAIDVEAPVIIGSTLRLEAPNPRVVRQQPPFGCDCAWSMAPENAGTFDSPDECITNCTLERTGTMVARVTVRCNQTEVTVFEQALTVIDPPFCDQGTDCDDGNPCTREDECKNDACIGMPIAGCKSCTSAAECDDGNPCTDNTCSAGGVCETANNAAACGDGNLCTLADACLNGVCVGTPADCSLLDDSCNAGACNPVTGQCQAQPINEGASCDDGNPATQDDICGQGVCTGVEPRWVVALQELPAAVLSIQVVSNGHVYAVGSDPQDGLGGYVLRYDGQNWERLPSGIQGDLWWVHEVAPDQIWMCGQSRVVIRYNPLTDQFAEVAVPPGDETLFGIWGLSGSDIWAVGGGISRGVVLRYDGADWTEIDLEEVLGGQSLPPMFKVWGPTANDVWIVGTAGVTLHHDGTDFTFRQTGVQRTLFTVHGDATGASVAAVGGFLSGEITEFVDGTWVDVTPSGALQVNAINFGAGGQVLAAGIQASTVRRIDGTWVIEDNGLDAIDDLDFHAVWVDPDGNAWAVGGNTTSAPLDRGVVAFYGTTDPGGEVVTATPPSGLSFEASECPKLGACCSEAGVCFTKVTPVECSAMGGRYKGDGFDCTLACDFCDCDGDGRVDISDYADFESCRSEAGLACCDVFDANGDGLLDLTDWGAFQIAFTAPDCILDTDCDDCDPCTANACEGGACTRMELPIDLTGDWTFIRTPSVSDGNGGDCLDPPVEGDQTIAVVSQTANDVTVSFSFSEDVDANDLVDASPGQLWFVTIPFSCPDGEPFVVDFAGSLTGSLLTATFNTGFLPYCGCRFNTSGSLSATVEDCGGKLSGSMSMTITRQCGQFGTDNCSVTHNFVATQP